MAQDEACHFPKQFNLEQHVYITPELTSTFYLAPALPLSFGTTYLNFLDFAF